MMLTRDNRALGLGVVIFFAMIVIGALLYILLDPVMASIETMTLDQTNNPRAETVINERATIWGGILFFVVFVSVISIIARSVFESRGGAP